MLPLIQMSAIFLHVFTLPTQDPLHYDYDEVPPPSEEPWADTNTRIRT